jgi:hypothetical protein
MSAVIQRAVALLALIATFLTSSAGVAAPANTTPADKCLAAPNTAAPPGHHWHYRTDRATQRKCWYVRAPGEPGQQTTAPAKKGAAKSVRSTPAQSGPPPATETGPTPVSTAEVARLPPQIEVPASAPPISAVPNDTAPSIQAAAIPTSASVEPRDPTPSVAPASSATAKDTAPASIPDTPAAPERTTVDTGAGRTAAAPSDPPVIGAMPQTAHEEIAASIPAASALPANTIAPPAILPPAVMSAASGKVQDSIAARTDAPAPVSDDQKGAAPGGTTTNTSGTLVMCSLILVFGLALVGVIRRMTRNYAAAGWDQLILVFGQALVGVMRRMTRKYAAARTDQIFTDDSWYNPYENPEFCRQFRQGSTLHGSWEGEDTTISGALPAAMKSTSQ